MGTEFAIANFPDIVTEFMENKDIDTGGSYDKFLYPFAMQVPGLQHIVDWIVLEESSKLIFFAERQQKSKSVLQYFHSSNHRGHIEDIEGQQIIEFNTGSGHCKIIGQNSWQVCQMAVEDAGHRS